MNPKRKPITLDDLVRLLNERPGLTCTEIGETLWPTAKGNRQAMARSAGKLVAAAIKADLIREKLEIGKSYSRRTFHPKRPWN